MTNALPRSPVSFFTAYNVVGDRPFSSYFGQLKMSFGLKHNGLKLSASYNGNPWKITFSAKAEHEHNVGNSFEEGPQGGFSSESNDKSAFSVTGVQVRRSHIPLTFSSDEIVNIWWDVGECPLPSNFDARKISSNITKALHRVNISGPIYLRVYGIIPEMRNDVIRFIRESSFQLIGFQLKDYKYDAHQENLMPVDCLLYSGLLEPPCIHMFLSDGNYCTKFFSDVLREDGFQVISVHPERVAADGAWHWEDLLA